MLDVEATLSDGRVARGRGHSRVESHDGALIDVKVAISGRAYGDRVGVDGVANAIAGGIHGGTGICEDVSALYACRKHGVNQAGIGGVDDDRVSAELGQT